MKVSKRDARKLVESILPELEPAFVETTGKKLVDGISLIGRNVIKDIGGEIIKPGNQYEVDEVRRVAVDHRQRLYDLIKSAADFDDLTEKMGAYTFKHSKNKTEKQNEN